MLKITVHDEPHQIRIQLEGKLTTPWVAELEDAWKRTDKPVLLDLTDVDYADLSGKYLLGWMYARGVRFVGSNLALQPITAEITRILVLVLLCVLPAAAEPMRLTLQRAVELAISPDGNARVHIAKEARRQADARAALTRGALLPNLDGSMTYLSQTRNLAAMGIQFPQLPIPGLSFPSFVGPFNMFDLRASLTQSVFDFAAWRRLRAAKAAVSAAEAERLNAEDQVVANVARAWLAALKADADVAASRANIQLADAIVELVESQKRAGTGTGIEVTRARVQLAHERQRLIAAETTRRRAQLQLLRVVGLRLDTEVTLDGTLSFQPADPVPVAAASKRALENRADYLAQVRREEASRLTGSATSLERLPSVVAVGDYGSSGSGPGNSLPTRSAGFSVRIPVFDGGRRDARRAEADSVLRQERLRSRDLKDSIELDIRVSLDALVSAEELVKVASEGFKLAGDELASAQRRYKAGVVTSVEVTDAQTRLERARDNHVAALFAHSQARVDLAQAQGTIEDFIR